MTLVDDLRRMTGVGSAQYEIDGRAYWTDEDLQGIITDRLCQRFIQAEVELIPSVNESSQLIFVDGRVRVVGKLDTTSAVVVSMGGKPIEGATVHADGRLEFATSQGATIPLLSALAYDLNGAAADVLTEWASAVTLGYDVSIDGQSMKRSQRHEQLLAQAAAFRARAVVGTIHMTRSDTKPHRGNNTRTSAVKRSWDRWGRPQG